MSQEDRHRGCHPEDTLLFGNSQIPKLRQALREYCWLLSHGYAEPSSLKLVGDKFQLKDRQRLLLMRSACTESQQSNRNRSRRDADRITNCDLWLDGFNVLITLESALSGGIVFVGQDGCYRDLSSVHGTYKRVHETELAIQLIGQTLNHLRPARIIWLLDQPVSNSGRLRQKLIETAQQNDWDWQVELCRSPDEKLKQVVGTVVTTDSVILDSVKDWFHLNQHVIDLHVPNARVIDFRHFLDDEQSNE